MKNPILAAFTALVILFATLLVVTQETKIQFDGALAAWVQAIGTIVALIIAIWVPLSLHEKRAKERSMEMLLRGQALAILLSPQLQLMKSEFELMPAYWDRLEPWVIPDDISNNLDKLWLMGEPGAHIIQLVNTIKAHNFFISSRYVRPMDMEDDDRKEFNSLVMDRVQLASESISDAMSGIDQLLEQKP